MREVFIDKSEVFAEEYIAKYDDGLNIVPCRLIDFGFLYHIRRKFVEEGIIKYGGRVGGSEVVYFSDREKMREMLNYFESLVVMQKLMVASGKKNEFWI